MASLPSLSGLSLVRPSGRRDGGDDHGPHSAPIGGIPTGRWLDENNIAYNQALLVNVARKHVDRNTSPEFVWDAAVCPPRPGVVSPTSGRAEGGDDVLVAALNDPAARVDVTPRNVVASWYGHCGRTPSMFTLGAKGDEARTRSKDWEYLAFPRSDAWMKMPLFNAYSANTKAERSGFHDIVLYADQHPTRRVKPDGSGDRTKYIFDSPSGYPHQFGPPHNHEAHGGRRPYYTPFSREDATELYYTTSREHTRHDYDEAETRHVQRGAPPGGAPGEQPGEQPGDHVWNPSIEHIVPQARFSRQPGSLPQDTRTPPEATGGRSAYGPNDPNGWMLERDATNARRDNLSLSFSDHSKGFNVPGSERGRVARKWLYMQATYGPMKGEFNESVLPYAVSVDQLLDRAVILRAARTALTTDEVVADKLMRATYGWGNPLLNASTQSLFLDPSSPLAQAWADVVFHRPSRPTWVRSRRDW